MVHLFLIQRSVNTGVYCNAKRASLTYNIIMGALHGRTHSHHPYVHAPILNVLKGQ